MIPRIGEWKVREDGVVTLVGAHCTACGETFFPERRICARCRCESMTAVEIVGPLTLETFTVVHELPRGFSGPLAIGYARSAAGPVILAPIDARPEELRVGMPLEIHAGPTRVDDDGRKVETYRFGPALAREGDPDA